MIDAEFSLHGLRTMLRPEDKGHYKFLAVTPDRDNYIRSISERVSRGEFRFRPLVQKTIRGFRAFRTQKLGDELVQRRLAELLKKAYRVRQTDRSAIVSQLRQLLMEPGPKQIVRLDISSFYESIDLQALFRRLSTDRLISDVALILLENYCDKVRQVLPTGVPRGMRLGSVLAELALNDFDSNARRTPGLYYYARYVDDIVAIAIDRAGDVKSTLAQSLPSPLKLNPTKSQVLSIRCRCAISCVHSPAACTCQDQCKCKPDSDRNYFLDYVGYRLELCDVPGQVGKFNTVTLSIAEKKIRRIKTRVILAILDHIKKPDIQLLKRRFAFLTENQAIRTVESKGALKAGIYYNYSLSDDMAQLNGLDRFARNVLFAHKSSFGMRISGALSSSIRKTLTRYSFQSGFRCRRSRRVSTGTMAIVRRCWKNA